jgi:TPP-dependent pyruvate/acetoin dehydrogenase alpha subunit
MDIWQVVEKSRSIMRDIRSMGEPYFLECKTYRYRAHSMFDPDLYRDPEEISHWKKRDPIDLWRGTLEKLGILSSSQYEEMQATVQAEVDRATDFGQKSSEPLLSSLMDFVICDG